ncbi:MAG: hypothetical protein ABIJ21_08575 [Nanoarchaeota archaeon]
MKSYEGMADDWYEGRFKTFLQEKQEERLTGGIDVLLGGEK